MIIWVVVSLLFLLERLRLQAFGLWCLVASFAKRQAPGIPVSVKLDVRSL